MSGVLVLVYILIFVALIYFVGVRPQQRRRKELESLLSRLQPGDEVVTVSGIYGTVTEVEPGGTVLLEVAQDTDIRIAQAAIARLVSDDPAAGAAGPADATGTP